MHNSTSPLPASNHKGNLRSVLGFSSFELMVAVAITAIVTGIAAPNLSSILSKSGVKTSAMALNSSLKLARNHALSSLKDVHLCALADGKSSQCERRRDYNANWSSGWIVFADLNDNHDLDAEDHLLQITQNESQTNIVFNQRGRLRFFPDGSARSAGFYICDQTGKETVHLFLLHTGRTRSKTQLSKQGKMICTQN